MNRLTIRKQTIKRNSTCWTTLRIWNNTSLNLQPVINKHQDQWWIQNDKERNWTPNLNTSFDCFLVFASNQQTFHKIGIAISRQIMLRNFWQNGFIFPAIKIFELCSSMRNNKFYSTSLNSQSSIDTYKKPRISILRTWTGSRCLYR
jgi:hypothetical protein